MLQRGGHQHYPSLSVFLHHLAKNPASNTVRLSRRSMALVAPLWFIGVIPTVWALFLERTVPVGLMISLTLTYAISAIVALSLSIHHDHKEAKTPEAEAAHQARATGAQMLQSMQRRTLHRSLDESILTLLEECAGQWLRIQSTLKMSFWTSKTLPESYISVREQSRVHADRAMQEALLLFEPYMVQQAGPQPWMDVVEDALQPIFGNKRPATSQFMPPMYDQGRRIGEKLKDLADGIDAISNSSPPLQMEEAPVSGIEQTLHEIQALKVAEDELNQLRLRL